MFSRCSFPQIIDAAKKSVLLITNYRNDNQLSMQKFGGILLDNSHMVEDFNLEEIFPITIFRKFLSFRKAGQMGGYIDKYIVFPKRLKNVLKQNHRSIGVVHVIDHSNSPYLKTIHKISSAKCIITCHDLIAIRTALGELPDAPLTSHSKKTTKLDPIFITLCRLFCLTRSRQYAI